MNQVLPADVETKPRKVLIVDDSKTQRLVLCARLSRWGFDVSQAADGAEALEIVAREPVPLILSDWVMPGMTGPELCHRLRAREEDRHTYFLLLTSKHCKEDVSAGLGAGADDFLSKPVDEGELLARLEAGLRQIDLQESLVNKNRQVMQAYTEVKTLYERIDADLRAAGALQQEFFPPPHDICNGIEVAAYYRPAGHVGGDLVGYFPIGADKLALYGIDVSGHSVASSLLTIRLAQHFNARDPEANIAFTRASSGELLVRSPEEVITDLNQRFLSGDSHDLYFTIVYAILSRETGQLSFCQAGHTHPLILRRDGTADYVGEGGPPVGLLPGVDFTSVDINLDAGDRLILYSDGFVEAEDRAGNMIGEESLAAAMTGLRDRPAAGLLADLVHAVEQRIGRDRFSDDVSLLLAQMPA